MIRFVRLALVVFCLWDCFAFAEALNDPGFLNSILDHRAKLNEKRVLTLAKITNDPYWHKRWWIEKAARILRGGVGLDDSDNIDQLMKLSEKEIVELLMNDPRLSDLVIDFNMYFLGFRADQIKNGGTYVSDVSFFPTAIESARQVTTGSGDYLALFNAKSVTYLSAPTIYKGEDKRPLAEISRERASAYLQKFQEFLDKIRNLKTAAQVCSEGAEFRDLSPLIQIGVPIAFVFNNVLIEPAWLGSVFAVCFNPNATYESAVEAHAHLYSLYESLFRKTADLIESNYQPRLASEFKTFDFSDFGMRPEVLAYGVTQRQSLPNSSTNYNRKRAAYVLKHYFCDDLNPIGIENPSQHANVPHGAQGSCRACHYKLDPMAGFFRNYGVFMFDFSNQRNIVFDDGARADLKAYNDSWKSNQNSGREWDVGYIRSTEKTSLNDYGSSLEDLHQLFRTAPEVKRCLVRRLFEYVVSDQQTIDASYLDYLTTEFTNRAETNSSDAFKWTVKQLLLSQSFAESDPDVNQCYDFKPGFDPTNRPPCRVAYVLEQNCVSCHNSVNGPKRLDLKHWIQLPDGTFNFPHQDLSGNQLGAGETMQRILDRLSAGESFRRMPPSGKYMSSQDRQELFLWADRMLKNGGRQ